MEKNRRGRGKWFCNRSSFWWKIWRKSVSEENKQVNENVSKIKFSIPVIYPTQPVKERNTRARAFLP